MLLTEVGFLEAVHAIFMHWVFGCFHSSLPYFPNPAEQGSDRDLASEQPLER
jgi:hypothetical protein